MRNYISYILCILLVWGMTGCMEEIQSEHDGSSEFSEYIQFSVDKEIMTKSVESEVCRQVYGNFEIEVRDFIEEVCTKANPVNTLEGEAGVTGFIYDGTLGDEAQPWDKMTNAAYAFDGNTLKGENLKWKDIKGTNLRVYACAPYMQSKYLDLKGPVPSLSYIVPDKVEDQKDIVSAYSDVLVSGSFGQSIPLAFSHAMTGIQIKSDFSCTVQSVVLSGVYGSGSYSLDGNWTVDSQSGKDFKIEFAGGKVVDAGGVVIDGKLTWMMIPQTLSDDAKLTVYCADNTSYEYSLKGLKWTKGKMITYTLYDRTKESSYIYFDLAAGNVTITNKTYKGYVYATRSSTGKREAIEITGTIGKGQSYYVYQSCVTNANSASKNYKVGYDSYDDATKKFTGSFTLPSYPRVTYKGQPWSDFITNNTYVDGDEEIDGKKGVIQAWDNAAGAGQASEAYINSAYVNGSGASGAVRDAGREATKNRIHITGDIGDVQLNIDNIYSSYQQRGSTPVRTRTQGGISFLPAQDGSHSVLTINIIGDNRFGCINYQNWTNPALNVLVFEGTGSLTVGDTDYYRDSSGLGSNRSCSVIGGKDEIKEEEDVYNIIFNSGVIYAGATPSSCTAIGGGGNGDTNIIINGGTITAVAKSTGTAIGGGTGLVQPGGVGNVTIKNGNVYAYNFRNASNVPAAAIGAAGSQSAIGGNSNVKIEGGYVYAYSEYGTAIGGGSSAQRHGGKGIIEISGGNIIAKTGDKNSVGIGGGSSYTEEYKRQGTETNNGGDAEVKITGNPTIRTGSIGGGTPGKGEAEGGKIGSAVITVEGGDIQAQFVMADSEGNEFNMSAGLIRNSSTSDTDYHCIQENGGAVYMEDGQFTMTGGVIRDCSAETGGAIYIKKGAKTDTPPSFRMSGGEIVMCYSESDGGAVYLEDGTVEVSGNAKIRSCYTGANGKGGAICINKTGTLSPSFTMSGGELSKNVASSRGGALHLEGGSVTISDGIISGNIVENGNGGAISINSGSFCMNKVSEGDGATINGNSALSKTDGAGYGGGVYITTSGEDVNVDILAGSIIGNSSARAGGGICVNLPSDDVSATVTVGQAGSNNLEYPNITSNITLLSGGGLYVDGKHASVIVNSGMIQNNETVGYVDNPDIMNETGMVTLNGGDVRSVNVVYAGNGGDTIDGDAVGQTEIIQRIVTDTNNTLVAPTFYRSGYKLVGWNTRADGLGKSYQNGQVVKRSADLKLYAMWQLQ